MASFQKDPKQISYENGTALMEHGPHALHEHV
ncbi:Atp-binding protein, partial [Globisporangium polare]